jgi:hypothetical protein
MISTVAVGVGAAGGWQALTWATGEAAATGAHLAIYRVCRPDSPLADIGMDPSSAPVELAAPALARAVAAVHVSAHRDDDFWYDDAMLCTHFLTVPADLELLASEVGPREGAAR